MQFVVMDTEVVPDPRLWTQPEDDPKAFAPPVAQQVVSIACVQVEAHSGQIVAMGLLKARGTERERLVALARRWPSQQTQTTLVTWNGRGFDVPVVVNRCLVNQVPLPQHLQAKHGTRYRYGTAHLDLMDQLADLGPGRFQSQDIVCKAIGWPGKGELDGSQVAGLYAAGELRKIAAYNLQDSVQLTAILSRYLLISGFWGPVQFLRCAGDLLRHVGTNELLAPLRELDRSIYMGTVEAPARVESDGQSGNTEEAARSAAD